MILKNFILKNSFTRILLYWISDWFFYQLNILKIYNPPFCGGEHLDPTFIPKNSSPVKQKKIIISSIVRELRCHTHVQTVDTSNLDNPVVLASGVNNNIFKMLEPIVVLWFKTYNIAILISRAL